MDKSRRKTEKLDKIRRLRYCFNVTNSTVRVRCSTVELFPNYKDLALRLDAENPKVRQNPFSVRAGSTGGNGLGQGKGEGE